MIANITNEGWEIIYHRAHAMLAMQIATKWKKEFRPIRFEETLLAIGTHDDLVREWEDKKLTDSGAPPDFTITKVDDEESIKKLNKLIEGAYYRSRWIAYLISKHVSFLNHDKRDTSPIWNTFIKEQESLQLKILSSLQIEQSDAEQTYFFLKWCDRLSLILTQRQLPDEQRSLEIGSDFQNIKYEVVYTKDKNVNVLPWPFEESEFTLEIDVVYIDKLKFEHKNELQSDLQSSDVHAVSWDFKNCYML